MKDREHFRQEGRVLHVDLWYPKVSSEPDTIEVGLVDTRAADGLRIEYDFSRDGWVVKQASRFEWPDDDEVQDPDWQEVAFIQAWAREATHRP